MTGHRHAIFKHAIKFYYVAYEMALVSMSTYISMQKKNTTLFMCIQSPMMATELANNLYPSVRSHCMH